MVFGSLNDLCPSHNEEYWIEREALVGIEDCRDQEKIIYSGTEDRFDLSIDLRRAISTLPYRLARICRHLQHESQQAVAERYHFSRAKLRKEIKKISRLLVAQGIGDYLTNPELGIPEPPTLKLRRRRRRKNANSK